MERLGPAALHRTRARSARRLALGLALTLVAAGCLGEVSRPAPPFEVVDLDGVPHNLTRYQGQVLILDLMATWCVPCIAQMEHLNDIRDAYPPEKVQILSVDTDPSETREQLLRFREQYGGERWPFAFDTDDMDAKLGVRILPKLVIIDPEGVIVFEAQGEAYPAAMARVINRYVEPIA